MDGKQTMTQPAVYYREVIEEHIRKGNAKTISLEDAYRYVPFTMAGAFARYVDDKLACSFVESRGYFNGVYIAGTMREKYEALLVSATNVDPKFIFIREFRKKKAAKITQHDLYFEGDKAPQLYLPWFASQGIRGCARTLANDIQKRNVAMHHLRYTPELYAEVAKQNCNLSFPIPRESKLDVITKDRMEAKS